MRYPIIYLMAALMVLYNWSDFYRITTADNFVQIDLYIDQDAKLACTVISELGVENHVMNLSFSGRPLQVKEVLSDKNSHRILVKTSAGIEAIDVRTNSHHLMYRVSNRPIGGSPNVSYVGAAEKRIKASN